MKPILLFILFIPFLHSCHDTISVLKGCCENPPLLEDVGPKGKIFIPNVFTPNNDGYNDQMLVRSDSMKKIEFLEIRNKDNVVVYYQENIALSDQTYTWDGTYNGQVERGLYSYKIQVIAIGDFSKTFKGKICNCPCDQKVDEDIIPIKNCKFGHICDPPEMFCFDELSCFDN